MNIVSLVGKVMGAGALVLAGSIASSSATVSMPLSCGIPTFNNCFWAVSSEYPS